MAASRVRGRLGNGRSSLDQPFVLDAEGGYGKSALSVECIRQTTW